MPLNKTGKNRWKEIAVAAGDGVWIQKDADSHWGGPRVGLVQEMTLPVQVVGLPRIGPGGRAYHAMQRTGARFDL